MEKGRDRQVSLPSSNESSSIPPNPSMKPIPSTHPPTHPPLTFLAAASSAALASCSCLDKVVE